jgi:hypothetical protein
MQKSSLGKPTRAFWIVGALAVVWNLIGVMSYLMTVTMSPETLDAMSEAERNLYTEIPAWATAAYAIAVFSGVLGSIALLLRKSWAVPLFVVSLVAILVQMGHAFFASAMLEVQGATAAVLPLLIMAIAAYLLWFARSARTRGWLA